MGRKIADVNLLSSCVLDLLNINVHTTTEHGANKLQQMVDKGRGSTHIQSAFSLIACDNLQREVQRAECKHKKSATYFFL